MAVGYIGLSRVVCCGDWSASSSVLSSGRTDKRITPTIFAGFHTLSLFPEKELRSREMDTDRSPTLVRVSLGVEG